MYRFSSRSLYFRLIATMVVSVSGVCSASAQDSVRTAKPDSLRHILASEIRVTDEGFTETAAIAGAPLVSISAKRLERQTGVTVLSEAARALSSSLDVRRYNSLGGVSFTTFRGLPAEYTVVYRDGIRVTNEQNSLTDLARISTHSTSRIELLPPSSSIALGGDAIGVAMNLISAPPTETSEVTIGSRAASFDDGDHIQEQEHFVNAGLHITDSTFLGLYGNTNYSTGRFPFLQSQTGSIVIRDNNDARLVNGGLTLTTQVSDNPLTFAIDYMKAERGAPGQPKFDFLGSSLDARQFDEDLYSRVSYALPLADDANLVAALGYQSQFESYTDVPNRIADRYLNRILSMNARTTSQISDAIELFAGVDGYRSILYSNENFNDGDSITSRNRVGAYTALATKTLNDKLQLTGAIRVESVQHSDIQFLPQISAQWTPIESWLAIFGAIGRSYHAPTLNELYWKVGGNEDLRDEKSWSAQLSIGSAPEPFSFGTVKLLLTAFTASVNDQIIWQPGVKSSEYTPMNVQRVRSSGVEVDARYTLDVTSRIQLAIREDLTLINSENLTLSMNGVSPEVPYSTPMQSLFTCELRDLSLCSIALLHRYRGHRYSTLANYSYTKLRPVAVIDLTVTSAPISFTDLFSIELQFTAINLTNEQYQEMQSFPLPGRTIRAGVTLTSQLYH